jgi:hypothetical protein
MQFSTIWNLAAAPPVRTMAGYALPAAFTARWEFDDDHTVELDVAVEHGLPVCNAIRVERNPARPSLSGSELRRIPVRSWLDFACAETNMRVERAGVLVPGAEEVPEIARQYRRRSMTPELLHEVAMEWVRARNDGDPPTAAVRDGFKVSARTAARWVAAAKVVHPEMFEEHGES